MNVRDLYSRIALAVLALVIVISVLGGKLAPFGPR